MSEQPAKMWPGRFREHFTPILKCACLSLPLLIVVGCHGKTETFAETPNGNFKLVVRTQHGEHPASIDVDACVTTIATKEFPKEPALCFLHGQNFKNLNLTWTSPSEIAVAFDRGSLQHFSNHVTIAASAGQPIEIHVMLQDRNVAPTQ